MNSEKRVKIIAEIANAHQGSYDAMKALIKASTKAGADIIKFQIYKYDYIATKDYYQYEDYKKLFFRKELWSEFIDYTKTLHKEIAVDILDEWGFNIAKEKRKDISYVKITPSIFLDDTLCENIFTLNLKTFVGVGGYKFHEIDTFLKKYEKYRSNLVLFLGFQGFPTDLKNINISRIVYYKNKFECEIGFADHCDAEAEKEMRMLIPQFALIAGARYIEKHITLNRKSKGYDYYSALEPKEFKDMIRKIKRALLIFGKPYHLNKEEENYRDLFRKIVYRNDVKQGTIIKKEDLGLRRADKEGLFASDLPNIVGKNEQK